MDKVTYESICEKLGFDVDSYVPPEFKGYEDDSVENPFSILSIEELNFLTDRIEARGEALKNEKQIYGYAN